MLEFLTRVSYQLNIVGYGLIAPVAINIATDLIFALIPIPIVWKLQVNLRTKIGLGSILGLGLLYVSGPLVTSVGTDNEQCFCDGDIQNSNAVQLLQGARLVW